MTLTAKLSIEKLAVFPCMLPDDLLGQAILLSLNDGMYVRATFVPTPIQHNLDGKGCSEEYSLLTTGCNCHANHIDLSKQEILEEEIGEQFFWFKAIVADHQALKPNDYASKGSLPTPMVTWEDDDKTNGTPHLGDIPYLAGKDFLVIVVLYAEGSNQPELDASKKAAATIVAQYLSVADLWLLSLKELNMIDAPQWPVPPDNSDYLMGSFVVPIEQPDLDVNKGFNDMCSLATSLSQVFTFEDPYSEIYTTYGLMESWEEIIFYEEYEEPFVLDSPSLVLEEFGLTSMHQPVVDPFVLLVDYT